MASEQAPLGTSANTSDQGAPPTEERGPNIDGTAEQAPLGTTAETSDPGAPTTEETGPNIDATAEQAPIGSSTNSSDPGALPTEENGDNIHRTSEQAPIGSTANTSDPGASPTEGQGTGGDANDQGVTDDSFDTRAKNTKGQVVGKFQKLFDRSSNKGPADTSEPGALPGTGGKTGNRGAIDDDSIETQMRNTGAQVVGTFQGLSESLKLAGQKMKGAKDGLSSKKT